MVTIHLHHDEGFDALFDYHSMLAGETRRLRKLGYRTPFVDDPEPDDYAVISRRAWTFRAGKARCTLCAFADSTSEICKRVEVGTEPKYELVCSGSAPSAGRVAA